MSMTREEAKTFLLQLHTDKQLNKSEHEALRIAIKVLGQESCSDVISRQAVIDTIELWLSCDDYNEAERNIMRAIRSVLYDLPSVNPVSNISLQITEREKYGRFN